MMMMIATGLLLLEFGTGATKLKIQNQRETNQTESGTVLAVKISSYIIYI